jgi:hypothetical protein
VVAAHRVGTVAATIRAADTGASFAATLSLDEGDDIVEVAIGCQGLAP